MDRKGFEKKILGCGRNTGKEGETPFPLGRLSLKEGMVNCSREIRLNKNGSVHWLAIYGPLVTLVMERPRQKGKR